MKKHGWCESLDGGKRDEATGYLEFYFRDIDGEKGVTIKAAGPIISIDKTERYTLDGDYDANGVFVFTSIRLTARDKDDSVWYLEHFVSGIQRKTAKKIMEALAVEDVFSCVEWEPEELMSRLQKISGFGAKKAKKVFDYVRRIPDDNKLYAYLCGLGVPYGAALACLDKGITLSDIKDNPYKMLDCGVPLEVCETVAKGSGVYPWDLKRIHAIARYVLNKIVNSGDTRVEYSRLCQAVTRLSAQNGFNRIPEDLAEIVISLSDYLKVYTDDGVEYASPSSTFWQEENIVRQLCRIAAAREGKDVSIETMVGVAEAETGMEYTEEQTRVFQALRTSGVSILVGGPGTGKTTVISGIVKAYRELFPVSPILLCAPTGRAASRLSEVCDYDAFTMHKAMDLKWFSNDPVVEPLAYGLIIVDEMSMCDTELFSYFMQAVPNDATVILAGDPEQIPSVGPGQVFRDLIDSETLPTYRFTQVIRQKEDSLIVRNAYAILEGKPLKAGPDFQIAVCKNDNALYNAIKNMKRKELPQILCPVKKTIAGTRSLNLLEQQRRNWQDKGIWLGDTLYHVGDHIIMTRNDYDLGFMNGDIGVIRDIQGDEIRIDFPEKSLLLDKNALGGIGLAYALTFHKSQGAECDDIMIVLPSRASVMASRELLYTAVTRAKNKVWLAAVDGVLENFLNGVRRTKRNCGLLSMLTGKVR